VSGAGTTQDAQDPQEAVQRVWREESARLVGALTRMTRDLSLAEDLAQDALVAALRQWPDSGVPDNPAAWLMQTAKRRAVDQFRRNDTLRRRTTELGQALERQEVDMPDLDSFVDHIEDDALRLVFLTCHPALSPESRAALTLRLVGGLTVPEIARAFLTKDTTVGQRISRAKKTLEGESFELPVGRQREQRLDDVMGVLYLIFNEGYTATAGEDWARPDLCAEAIRLTRMLADLAGQEPEVAGLLALMELQASRLHARTDTEGRPVLLEDQDRSRWDALMVRRGLAALDRAMAMVAAGLVAGPYVVQAQIAACHARAATAGETDWPAIAGWYDVLARLGDNPVVEVNRAVAHGRAHSPEEGLAVLDEVASHRSLSASHLVPAVRGDLLTRAGRHAEASVEFERAAELTSNHAERAVLSARAAEARLHGHTSGGRPTCAVLLTLTAEVGEDFPCRVRTGRGPGPWSRAARRTAAKEDLMNLRLTAAVAVIASVAIHLTLWLQGMRSVHVIGPAFLLNVAGGIVIAVLLVRWPHPGAGVLAACFGAATLGAFTLASTIGLFGDHESWAGFSVYAAATVEIVAIMAGLMIMLEDPEPQPVLAGAHRAVRSNLSERA
jgi:RNA polymerase sigma factor (sigma-70 family)